MVQGDRRNAPMLITLPSGQTVTFNRGPDADAQGFALGSHAGDGQRQSDEGISKGERSRNREIGERRWRGVHDQRRRRPSTRLCAGGRGWSPSNTDALRLMHAGFIFNDRAAEDHFYKDILGFHTYWHGGMKEDVDQWVAMQVPDGTDWIEYMLRIPPDANKHTHRRE